MVEPARATAVAPRKDACLEVQLEWVNHASFIVAHEGVRLISDPWLDGKAFADSWALLSETRFDPAEFASITHIWLSHEHPDHFSPSTLRSISEVARGQITVLTQPTRDRKVFNFCRDLGFRDVVELPAGQWFALTDGVSVMCQPVKMDDSWLAIRAADVILLNLNDCMLTGSGEIAEVARQIGAPVDVLLTQFSFASWIGGPDDAALHERAAADARDRITLQTQVIAPKWVVPFASFVWFCHEENAFMNDAINRVDRIVDHLREHTAAQPVVLYPADRWEPSGEEPTTAALARYKADYASIPARPRTPARAWDEGELDAAARQFSRSLRRFHGWPLRLAHLLGRVPATPIWLKDKSCAVLLSLSGLHASSLSREACDMAMSSDALAYVLQNLWGGMTLIIGGRFDVPAGGDLRVGGPPKRFRRYINLADDANHGWPLRKEVAFRIRNRLPGLRRLDWLARHRPSTT